MTPLAPDTPNAGTPSARSAATRSTFSPGHHHLHDVQHRIVGDAPAADDGRFDPEAPRQRGRLRAAAVHDQQPPPGPRARDLRGGVRQRLPFQHVASQLDDRVDGTGHRAGYGHGPGSSSDIVSGRPSIRFMLWIACPAPPLIRLSVALTIASVHVGRPVPAAAPSVKPTSA